jgi:hypothetical protein
MSVVPRTVAQIAAEWNLRVIEFEPGEEHYVASLGAWRVDEIRAVVDALEQSERLRLAEEVEAEREERVRDIRERNQSLVGYLGNLKTSNNELASRIKRLAMQGLCAVADEDVDNYISCTRAFRALCDELLAAWRAHSEETKA